MIHGPNIKKLIIHKMSMDAVPKGGGFNDAILFLSNKERIVSGALAATQWVESAIQTIRQAAEPNPWKMASDEIIAEEILRQIEEKGKPKNGPAHLVPHLSSCRVGKGSL